MHRLGERRLRPVKHVELLGIAKRLTVGGQIRRDDLVWRGGQAAGCRRGNHGREDDWPQVLETPTFQSEAIQQKFERAVKPSSCLYLSPLRDASSGRVNNVGFPPIRDISALGLLSTHPEHLASLRGGAEPFA